MYIRFLEFGPESPHDLVLKRSIHPDHRNTKIYAQICECRADTRITFLLRRCQRNNIVSGIHIARSGRVIDKINVGRKENGLTLWKQPLFDTEEDERAIMNKKCREDEEKRDTVKGKTHAMFAAKKVKAIADTKSVYMEHNKNNRNLRTKQLAEGETHQQSNTQKIAQELRLTKKIREIRPGRPRTPVTRLNTRPKLNTKKRPLDKDDKDVQPDGKGQDANKKRKRTRNKPAD
jgi:hypothetical protein